MPIHQEGQSTAKPWFSEEYAFPTENDAEAALVVPATDFPNPCKNLQNTGAWFGDVEDSSEVSSESASNEDPSPELPKSDETQETVPEHPPQKPAHQGSSSALPQDVRPSSPSIPEGQGSSVALPQDVGPTLPSIPQGQSFNQTSSKISALGPSPTNVGNQRSSERFALDTSPTYIGNQGSSERFALGTSPAYIGNQVSSERFALGISPAYVGNQGSSERFALVPSATYANKGPSELVVQSSASRNSLEELQRRHYELKQELEKARIQAEIEEMEESLAQLRSAKPNRLQRMTSQRATGGLELDFNLRMRQ